MTDPGTRAGNLHAAEASRAVLGRGWIYTLGTASPILAQLVVTPAVTRLLGPDGGWGRVATGLVLVQVTMMLASLGFPSVITRQALLGGGGVAGARSLFLRGSLLTCAVSVVALVTRRWWGVGFGGVEADLAVVAIGAGTLFVIVENGQALLRALDRPVAFVVLSAVASLGGPLLGLALVLAGGEPGWLRYLLGLAGGYALGAALAAYLCLRGVRTHRVGDVRAALRLGLPVLPHLVSLYLATGALVLLAGRLFGDREAGRIQLAILVGGSPGVLIGALNNAWAPAIYRVPTAYRGQAVERTARDVAAIAALLCGGVSLLSPWLLRLLADDRYELGPLVPVVAVVTVGSLVSVAYLANVHLVFAAGRPLGLALVTPVSLAVGLAVGLACTLTPDRNQLVLLAVGFPSTYVALATGTALLRRRIGAPRWRESRLVGPMLLGLTLVLAGAGLPTEGAAALGRWALAALAGTGIILVTRRLLARVRPRRSQ